MAKHLSRRTFNKVASAASVAVASPFIHSKRARAQDTVDVLVIGSGLSGLNAAWNLSEAGLDTLVLEGSDRIGGRVWTASETWETNAGETPIELGASQVGPSYARVRDAIDRLELPTMNQDRDLLPFSYHIGGTHVSASEWSDSPANRTVGNEREILPERFSANLLSRLNPLIELDDWLSPKFSSFDISLYDLFKQSGVSDEGIRLASAAGVNDLHGVSALRFFQETTRGALEAEFLGPLDKDGKPIEYWPKNFVGGTIALPTAMAAQLSRGVRVNQQVTSIELEDNAVEVRTLDGSRYRARFVISAVPFSVLKYVNISSRPPEAQFNAIRNLRYSETTRAFCRIKEPFWQEDDKGASLISDGGTGAFWAINNGTGEGEHRGMFVLTNMKGSQVSARSAEAATQYLVDEMERIRPASRGQIEILKYHTWERQPLQRGCSPMFAPGQVTAFANEMIVPHGRLHFAGEHTRRLDYGMEAAMESGERAAFEVLDRA